MEFSQVVRRRRMVRHFRPDPVSLETVDRMLELARHAPSAGFTQGYSFIVVTRPDLRAAIAEMYEDEDEDEEKKEPQFDPFMAEAPVLIVACTSEAAYHRRYQQEDKIRDDGTEIVWPVPYWHVDAGAAVMILLLAVVDEGLAACFVGITADHVDDVRTLLNIPDEVTAVGIVAIGHRAPDVLSPSLQRGRIPDADYIHREGW